MILDLRTYAVMPSKVRDYLALYQAEGMATQVGHLGHMVGFFTTDVGPVNQIVHMWRYEDHADRERRRAAMLADPKWLAYGEKATQMLLSMENRILRPTAFSTMK